MGKAFGSALRLPDLAAAPASPPADTQLLYMRDGQIYRKDSSGAEAAVGAFTQVVLLDSGQTVAQYETANGVTVPVGTVVFQKA